MNDHKTKPDHQNDTALPRIGIGVIVIHNHKVLMIERKHSHGAGTWAMPGGHLEWGEDPGNGAIRELKEETGVVMDDPRLVAVTNDFFEEEKKHYITLWMQGEWISGEGEIVSPEEVTRLGWFAWDALPEPRFLPLQHLLNNQSYPKDAIGRIIYACEMLHIIRRDEACLIKDNRCG